MMANSPVVETSNCHSMPYPVQCCNEVNEEMANSPEVETSDCHFMPYPVQCCSDVNEEMANSPVVESLETSDCHSLPNYPIQCSSAGNEGHASSQIVVVAYKMVELKDKREELVIGKENFIPLHFLDSKTQNTYLHK